MRETTSCTATVFSPQTGKVYQRRCAKSHQVVAARRPWTRTPGCGWRGEREQRWSLCLPQPRALSNHASPERRQPGQGLGLDRADAAPSQPGKRCRGCNPGEQCSHCTATRAGLKQRYGMWDAFGYYGRHFDIMGGIWILWKAFGFASHMDIFRIDRNVLQHCAIVNVYHSVVGAVQQCAMAIAHALVDMPCTQARGAGSGRPSS